MYASLAMAFGDERRRCVRGDPACHGRPVGRLYTRPAWTVSLLGTAFIPASIEEFSPSRPAAVTAGLFVPNFAHGRHRASLTATNRMISIAELR
jgi:hypothetical protein